MKKKDDLVVAAVACAAAFVLLGLQMGRPQVANQSTSEANLVVAKNKSRLRRPAVPKLAETSTKPGIATWMIGFGVVGTGLFKSKTPPKS